MNSVLKEDFDNILASEDLSHLDGARFLISGGTGMILSYFVKFLLYKNSKQENLDKTKINIITRGNMRNTMSMFFGDSGGDASEAMYLNPIFRNVNTMRPDCIDDQIDYVVHGASIATSSDFSNERGIWQPNLTGTINMAETALEWGAKKFLFLSSGAVYGDRSTFPAEDDLGCLDHNDFFSCYGESKRAAEMILHSYSRISPLEISIARLNHTYGPGVREDDSRVYSDLTWSVARGKSLRVVSPLSTRSYLYLSDAVIYFIRMLKSKETIFNIGNSEASVSVAEIAEYLSQKYDLPISCDSAGIHHPKQISTCNNKKACDKLSWTPKVGWQEGFDRTIGYIKKEIEEGRC